MCPNIVRLLMFHNYVSLFLSQAIGQFHVEIFAEGLSNVNEQEVRTKITEADYVNQTDRSFCKLFQIHFHFF